MLYHSTRVAMHNNQDGTMPHPLMADENGLLCYALMDDPETLLTCYRFGIFPWFNFGKIGAFFFPEKRYVIPPGEVKVPKSIRSFFNQNKFTVTFDTCFTEVIKACSEVKRKGESSTWISDQFLQVYSQLHQMGFAHSVEVWQQDKLVGGLYGVATGKVFSGESMFSYVSNASRFALISLARVLEKNEFSLIDCQVYNPFLESFGGEEISSKLFYNHMKKNLLQPDWCGSWSNEALK